MKCFKVTYKDKNYKVHAKDSIEAVMHVMQLRDDRLSPMTYRKLKELGYSSEDWKDWDQKQANEIVAKGRKETKKQGSSSENKNNTVSKPNQSNIQRKESSKNKIENSITSKNFEKELKALNGSQILDDPDKVAEILNNNNIKASDDEEENMYKLQDLVIKNAGLSRNDFDEEGDLYGATLLTMIDYPEDFDATDDKNIKLANALKSLLGKGSDNNKNNSTQSNIGIEDFKLSKNTKPANRSRTHYSVSSGTSDKESANKILKQLKNIDPELKLKLIKYRDGSYGIDGPEDSSEQAEKFENAYEKYVNETSDVAYNILQKKMGSPANGSEASDEEKKKLNIKARTASAIRDPNFRYKLFSAYNTEDPFELYDKIKRDGHNDLAHDAMDLCRKERSKNK